MGDKSFCNLVEIDLAKFNGDMEGLAEAIIVAARANYRQTCVNLKDGVLQDSWHELNEYLRLCGVGVTGVVQWEHQKNDYAWEWLANGARHGANSMAEELGLPYAKAVTTIKPSGTLSKIMDTTEGIHKPLGKYIFNWISFSKEDPLVPKLKEAGYRHMDKPFNETAILFCFPVSYENVVFDRVTLYTGEEAEVNRESAVEQLDRYKMVMRHYIDHNASITVSYDPTEIPAIVNWLDKNWDDYVGVSFLYRADPTKNAEDLGYAYLPQEVVTEARWHEYASTLRPVDLTYAVSSDTLDDECVSGACPIR